MKKHDFKSEWLPTETADVKETRYNGSGYNFFDRVQAISLLHLIAGLSQAFMGITVILIALMGFIQPFWLSVFVGMVASATTLIGIYLVLLTLSGIYDRQDVLRNAMKRVIEARN